MAIALFEIPVSGWTCLRTNPKKGVHHHHHITNPTPLTLVDVGAVRLLADLSALLLLAVRARGRRLARRLLRGLGRLRLGGLRGHGRRGSLARSGRRLYTQKIDTSQRAQPRSLSQNRSRKLTLGAISRLHNPSQKQNKVVRE